MAKYIYPAIFSAENELFVVNFPDLEGCYTQGTGLMDALDMAEDVLCLTLYNLEESFSEIPRPSEVSSLELKAGEFVSLVSCDTILQQ